jgi:uncharacterized cupin superfamily protein
VGYRLLGSDEMHWRATNVLGAENADLALTLGIDAFGVRLWRMRPGQASLSHRHREQQELYLLLEGEGRVRVDGELLILASMTALVVDPASVRQIFNDTDRDQVWLIAGAPVERLQISELPAADRDYLYPDGLESLPPELRREPPSTP